MKENILRFSFPFVLFLFLHFTKVNSFVMEAGAAGAGDADNSKKRKHNEIAAVADENSVNLKPWLERVRYILSPFSIFFRCCR